MSSNSLLPPNATPQEIALAETVARISDVPVLVRQSHDPATCPAQLLPWLAWAYSVDEWDPTWSEAEKRGVIANSLYVHQHKGTIGALDSALTPLGYLLEVKEWFEEIPQATPYTFKVVLGTTGKVVSDNLYNKVERIIRTAKNERSQLTGITIKSDVRGNMYFGATAMAGEECTIYPYNPGEAGVSSPFYYAAACIVIDTTTVGPQL
jgi:phage tail P2-like protein